MFIRAGMLLFPMQVKMTPVGGLPFSRVYYNSLPIVVMGVMVILLEVIRFLRFLFDREDYESRERKGDN